MILETQDLRTLAARVSALAGSVRLNSPILISRHRQIQNQLISLAAFFNRIADLVEGNENSIQNAQRIHISPQAGWNFYASGSGSVPGLLQGDSISGKLGADWTAGAGSAAWNASGAYASISGDFVQLGGSCSASFQIVSENNFDPRLTLNVGTAGHAAGAEVSAGYAFMDFEASVRAAGEVGAVYAEAEAVFAVDEQTISFQAGAAVARGECELAIDLAGLKITLTLSGSLGSAEAGATYSVSGDSWETSVNLGLGVGAGVGVRIETP